MEPFRIWACPGSFWANSIFSSLGHGSDLILHIMIVGNSLHDLAIVSFMFCLINFAYLTHLKFRAPFIFAQSCAKISGSENMFNFACAKINGTSQIRPIINVHDTGQTWKRCNSSYSNIPMMITWVYHTFK